MPTNGSLLLGYSDPVYSAVRSFVPGCHYEIARARARDWVSTTSRKSSYTGIFPTNLQSIQMHDVLKVYAESQSGYTLHRSPR